MNAYRYRVTAVNEDQSKRYWYWVGTIITLEADNAFIEARTNKDQLDLWLSKGCTKVLLEIRVLNYGWMVILQSSIPK